MKKKYLEIVRDSDGAVVKRFDITGKTDRSVDRLENGLSVNMNHASFSLRFGEYNREMPEVDNETRSNQNRKRKQQ